MKKTAPPLSLLVLSALLALSGCSGPAMLGTGMAAGIWATKPATPPPADTASQIAEHESWCYATIADPMCYDHPQDVPPGRLITVEPMNRIPLTARAYHDAVVEDQ